VIETLQEEGWEAYLVGGGVRDLLLGLNPKDFDVATNATPEAVAGIFKRSRVIGRRFKIVHVRMGRELIEVTTFRGTHDTKKAKHQASQNEKGILLRDNVYGDLESDAKRRDFTVNALYFNPTTEEIVDYCNGLQDLREKTLRIIGEPESRYKEDPVRMLRAIRFKAKLGFHFAKATETPITSLSVYLKEIPPARLFEEGLKLFLSGKAKPTLQQLHSYHLLQHLFPGAARALDSDNELNKRLLIQAAENTDKRIAEQKRVTPAFIYAALLWPCLQEEIQILKPNARAGTQETLF
jgi:poly(A) polymerase